MTETKKVHFSYDPMVLTRMWLQKYVEKYIEDRFPYKAKQFACYEFLQTMEDNELEDILLQFITNENLEFITFDDWKTDCKNIFKCIFETERFKNIEFEFKKKGHSLTGLGVIDNSDNTFYDCIATHHWTTIKEIMSTKYPHLYEALEEMNYGHQPTDNYKGITRKELDEFVLSNFELIGATNQLEYYLD